MRATDDMYENVDPELIKDVIEATEKETLEQYGVHDDHDDKVRKQKLKIHAENGFHDTITFQKQLFYVDEEHKRDEIMKCFCVVMDPGNGKKPELLTMRFRTDPTHTHRPVLFQTPKECAYFLKICFVNQKFARIVELTDEIYAKNQFHERGSFILRPSTIVLPGKLHKKGLDRIIE